MSEDWPTPSYEFCQRCRPLNSLEHRLWNRHCLYCGWSAPRPREGEVVDAREQDGKLWIDLHHVHVGNEYNREDPIMLSEEEARRLRDQLDHVLRCRAMPEAPAKVAP